MRRLLKKRIDTLSTLLIAAMLISFAGCSDGKKSAHVSELPQPLRDILFPTNNADITIPAADTSNPLIDEEKLIYSNQEKPIIYGVGAAGITFDTTLEESKSLLSKPSEGQINAMPFITTHREGVAIQWSGQSPKHPKLIIIKDPNIGVLDLPEPIGPIFIGRDLSKELKDEASAKAFVTTTYNLLEHKESSFNCLTEQKCRQLLPPQNINHIILGWDQKLKIHIDAATYKVVLIILIQYLEQETLNVDNFDYAKYEFTSKAGSIKLGDSWESIRSKLHPNSDWTTKTFPNGFSLNLGNTSLIFTKSDFNRDYIAPSPQETLNGFKIAIDIAKLTKERVGSLLRNFVPEGVQPFILNGTGGLEVFYFDPSSGIGRILRLIIPQGQGTELPAILELALLNGPFDAITIPKLNEPVTVSQATLAGFKLGDEIELSDINSEGEEATVTYSGKHGRYKHLSNGKIETAYINRETGDVQQGTQKVDAVYVGSLETELAIQITKTDGTSKMGKIVSITTSKQFGWIKTKCGYFTILVGPGSSTTETLEKLNDAAQTAEEGSNRGIDIPKCPAAITWITAEDGTQIITSIYFPEEGLRLHYRNDLLSSVTIYSVPKEENTK